MHNHDDLISISVKMWVTSSSIPNWLHCSSWSTPLLHIKHNAAQKSLNELLKDNQFPVKVNVPKWLTLFTTLMHCSGDEDRRQRFEVCVKKLKKTPRVDPKLNLDILKSIISETVYLCFFFFGLGRLCKAIFTPPSTTCIQASLSNKRSMFQASAFITLAWMHNIAHF